MLQVSDGDVRQEMTVEAVENLMLETEEAQATANVRRSELMGMLMDLMVDLPCRLVGFMQEISRIIGGNLTVEDEDAVLSELAEIEKMEADALAALLPEAPTAIETGLGVECRVEGMVAFADGSCGFDCAEQVDVEVASASSSVPAKAAPGKVKEPIAILG